MTQRLLMVVVLLTGVCTAYAADVTHALMGEWELDLYNTARDRLSRQTPAVIEHMGEDLEAAISSMAALPESQRIRMTVTDSGMITPANRNSEELRFAYRVVGGHSSLAIIE